MAVNPFEIQVANDAGQQLMGLGALLGESADRRKSQQAALAAQAEIRDAFEVGDPSMIADVSMKYPELASKFNEGLGLGNDMQKQQANEFMRSVLLAPEDQVPGLFEERIQMLTREGRDPSNTIKAMEMYQQDPEAAMEEVQRVFAATSPQDFMDFKEMTAEPDPAKRDLVQWIKPDGTTQSLETDSLGNYFDMSGEKVSLSPQDRIIEGATITGSPDQYGLTDRESLELDSQEIATRNMINLTGDALEMLADVPDVNTLTARGASAINGLQQEFKAVARIFTGEDFDESLLDIANPDYQDAFDEMGIQNARMRSLLTSMAYARAASREAGGRFSDRDIRASLEELGASADPATFAQVMRDVAGRVARDFETAFKVKTKKDFPGDLGLDRLGATGERPIITTQEEYDALPSGAMFIEDGRPYRKP